MPRKGMTGAHGGWIPENRQPEIVTNNLHNKSLPGSRGFVKFEQQWHKTAAILRASGWGVVQIADHLDYSQETIKRLDKTPWFQAHVAKLVEERVGANDVLALAKEAAIDAHRVIIRIMNDDKAGARVQLQAATTIMDRVFGKPLQKVEMDNTIRSADPVAEVERLKKEKLDLQMRVGDVNG